MKAATCRILTVALFTSAACALAGGDFVDLFNGKNLDGWVQRNGKAKYEAVDGAIVGTSVPNSPNSFLCTEKDYGDFEMEFEFKGHPNMNSGVQFRSESLDDYKEGRVHGYQCELEDENKNRDWSAGIYDEARRGWLFPGKAGKPENEDFGEQGKRLWKNGDWNKVKIRCQGDHIQTWLNGEARADLKDDETAKGFFALQVHGVGGNATPMSVMWRKIRIKELD